MSQLDRSGIYARSMTRTAIKQSGTVDSVGSPKTTPPRCFLNGGLNLK